MKSNNLINKVFKDLDINTYRFNKLRITCDDPSIYYQKFIELKKKLNINIYLLGNIEKGTETEKPHFHSWFLTQPELSYFKILKEFKKIMCSGGNEKFSLPNTETKKAKKIFKDKTEKEKMNLLSYPIKENLDLSKPMKFSENIDLEKLIEYRKEIEKNKNMKTEQKKSDSIISVLNEIMVIEYPDKKSKNICKFSFEQDLVKEIFRYYRIRNKVIGSIDYLKRVKFSIMNKYKIFRNDEIYKVTWNELYMYDYEIDSVYTLKSNSLAGQ